MKNIRFVDLVVGDKERDTVLKVLDRAWLRQGPETEKLEKEICRLTGARHAVATSSGTGALHLSLLSLGIKGKVLVPSLTFPATSNVIVNSGCAPSFVDIDPSTYTIDPDEIESAVKKDAGISAVMPVHMFGMPAEMGRIREIADEHGLRIIEDCAQAFGAEFRGKGVGLWGDTGCFSFDTIKQFTSGEGGCMITDDDKTAEKARAMKDHGRVNGRFVFFGLNYKPTDMQAALLNAQLRSFESVMEKRRFLFEHYTESLSGMGVDVPGIPGYVKHAYTYYTIKLPCDAESVRTSLLGEGVETKTYPPVHLEPAYAIYRKGLPVTEDACRRLLSPPLHNLMDSTEVEGVSESLCRVLKRFI